MKTSAARVLGALVGAGLLLSGAEPGSAGTLTAYTFDDVVIVWKSQQDLEAAVDLIAQGNVKDGDFDALVQCWVNSGHPAVLLSDLSDGLLLKVRVENEDCEGIVFAEEFRE